MKRNIVVTTKSWNTEQFERLSREAPAQWHLITDKTELNYDHLRSLNPTYIFFPHWSWRIPKEVYEAFDCVVFHMTDVPFGRGGSPLQNLIERGFTETKLCAIQVTGELDAGPVFLRESLSLMGDAEEIFIRAAQLAFDMIRQIAIERPEPIPQQGIPKLFRRRRPEESRIPDDASLDRVFDWIRMLDAEGYPKAFIETNHFRIEFSRAGLRHGHVVADARITLRGDKN